jgi:hypothetical protein
VKLKSDVSRDAILALAESLDWPPMTFGPRKQLHDEGDYRAEPMLDGGHRIALYDELAKLDDARRFQSAPMPGVRPGPPPTS